LRDGFTLIEVIVAMSVLAIIAAMGAIFVKPLIDSYVDQQRRAELSDVADTALRRMARDIRAALPNSVRVNAPGDVFLELLLTRTGGRYRSASDDGTAAGEDPLEFSFADTAFDTLGPLSSLPGQVIVANTDRVAVHNLGIAGANAYAGDNTSVITAYASPAPAGAATSEDRISIAPKQFPLESPGRRFQVISGPVTFECRSAGLAGGEGTGRLLRHAGYAVPPVPLPAAPPPPPPTPNPSVLASYLSACTMSYSSVALQARGVVTLQLELTRGGETVSLYQEVHVNNVP
jgi:MSHA biogenesis protein MshO